MEYLGLWILIEQLATVATNGKENAGDGKKIVATAARISDRVHVHAFLRIAMNST